MTQRHRTFISYHHANDQRYKDLLVSMLPGYAIDQSVGYGDIDGDLMTETIRRQIRDEYIRDATVTLVLVGTETWQRKHVDWEIASSLRDTQYNARCGLLGILLPSYQQPSPGYYNPYTIPPRLYDNVSSGFAKLYNWSDNPAEVQGWIHEAFARRDTVNPDISRDHFGRNRTGVCWRP